MKVRHYWSRLKEFPLHKEGHNLNAKHIVSVRMEVLFMRCCGIDEKGKVSRSLDVSNCTPISTFCKLLSKSEPLNELDCPSLKKIEEIQYCERSK